MGSILAEEFGDIVRELKSDLVFILECFVSDSYDGIGCGRFAVVCRDRDSDLLTGQGDRRFDIYGKDLRFSDLYVA